MSHTVLRFHFVWATKKRKKLLTPDVEAVLYPAIFDIAKRVGGHAIAAGGYDDHCHLIAAVRPNFAISSFMRDLKSRATMVIRAEFPTLARFSWQVGYSAFTLNAYDIEGAVSYVRNQREHHENDSLRDEFEFLERYLTKAPG